MNNHVLNMIAVAVLMVLAIVNMGYTIKANREEKEWSEFCHFTLTITSVGIITIVLSTYFV